MAKLLGSGFVDGLVASLEEEAKRVQQENLQRVRDRAASARAAGQLDHDLDGEQLQTISNALHSLLRPPVFTGGTPATPFRVPALVNNELAQHHHLYHFCERSARPLLEKWFSENECDLFNEATRRAISVTAMRQHIAPMSFTAQTKVIGSALAALVYAVGQQEAIALFDLWLAALPPSDAEKLQLRVLVLIRKIRPDLALSSPVPSVSDAGEEAVVTGLHHPIMEEATAAEEERDDLQSQASSQPSLVAAMQSSNLGSDVMQAQMEQMAQMQAQMQAQQAQMAQMQAQMQAATQAAAAQAAQQATEVASQRAAQAAAPVWHGAGSSPPLGMMVQYGQAKHFLHARYEANIIQPQQREIDHLRAEVARLSGELLPTDPRYHEIVREANARFSKPGGIKLFLKRKQKLIDLKKQLQSKEELVASLIHELGEIRLNCALYTQQLEHDAAAMTYIENDRRDRVARMEAEEERRMKAKEERLEREKEKVDRARKQRSRPDQAVKPEILAAFMPAARSRPASASSSRTPSLPSRPSTSSSQARAWQTMAEIHDIEAMEDDEEDDEVDENDV